MIGASGTHLIKIGGTSRSAHERRIELSQHTGVPGEFEIIAEIVTHNWQALERVTHRALRKHRRAGEFFEVAQETALEIVNSLNERLKSKKSGYEKQHIAILSSGEEIPPDGVAFQWTHSGSVSIFYKHHIIGVIDDCRAEAIFEPCVDQGYDQHRQIILVSNWRGNDKWSSSSLMRTTCKKIEPFVALIGQLIRPNLTLSLMDEKFLVLWGFDKTWIPIVYGSFSTENKGRFFWRRSVKIVDCRLSQNVPRILERMAPSEMDVCVKAGRRLPIEAYRRQIPDISGAELERCLENMVLETIASQSCISGSFLKEDKVKVEMLGYEGHFRRRF
jgi:hypothetical protein